MEINVRDFIQKNYTEYTGDESFLCGPTIRTLVLWEQCKELLKQEKENGGVLDIDTTTFSGINNFAPGYIDKHQELIVGLQTDAPLKRIVNPYGGMRMVEASLKAYNRELDGDLKEHFNEFRKTHNQGVFDVYTPEMRLARHTGLLTGLPDAYGRGRIIGDYRRVALYGIDALIDEKRKDWEALTGEMLEDTIKLREEVAEQIRALKEIKLMAESYDYPEIAKPAKNCQQALQHIYFAYLAGAKENNGAATSLGRISTFVDIYAEADLRRGVPEENIQELID
jgi:formate C-acetyltransferase